MGPLDLAGLPLHALLLLDSVPIIYFLEDHPELGPRFDPLFDMHSRGLVRFAVTTVTIAEVLTGPIALGEEALVRRYRGILESWQVIALDSSIAESAARLRGSLRLKLPDAVQVASALAINADALVTHDRDFAKVSALRVIS
ncbi:MAG TPA: PIN domain-containing protein [Thermoanaerobaculia bacterium]|nr:PIN domain-containing protein [Thermoanaerobaculia bacterium]